MAEQYNIDKVKKLGKALDNKYRIDILKICEAEEHNITELQKKLSISYPHVHNHVHILRDADLVETYDKTDSKGKNLMVRSKYKIEGNQIKEIK